MTEKEISITLALREFPDYGDLMPREDFNISVEVGTFIDYDGHGYLATEEGYFQVFKVVPSEWQRIDHYASEVFTHVLWFNR